MRQSPVAQHHRVGAPQEADRLLHPGDDEVARDLDEGLPGGERAAAWSSAARIASVRSDRTASGKNRRSSPVSHIWRRSSASRSRRSAMQVFQAASTLELDGKPLVAGGKLR